MNSTGKQFKQDCSGCAEVGGGVLVETNEESILRRGERKHRTACPSFCPSSENINVKIVWRYPEQSKMCHSEWKWISKSCLSSVTCTRHNRTCLCGRTGGQIICCKQTKWRKGVLCEVKKGFHWRPDWRPPKISTSPQTSITHSFLTIPSQSIPRYQKATLGV